MPSLLPEQTPQNGHQNLATKTNLYFNLGSGFLPDMDEGAFVLDYRTPPGTSLEETDRIVRHVQQFLKDTPEVESYSRRTGARLALAIAEPNTGDLGKLVIQLVRIDPLTVLY